MLKSIVCISLILVSSFSFAESCNSQDASQRKACGVIKVNETCSLLKSEKCNDKLKLLASVYISQTSNKNDVMDVESYINAVCTTSDCVHDVLNYVITNKKLKQDSYVLVDSENITCVQTKSVPSHKTMLLDKKELVSLSENENQLWSTSARYIKSNYSKINNCSTDKALTLKVN